MCCAYDIYIWCNNTIQQHVTLNLLIAYLMSIFKERNIKLLNTKIKHKHQEI